MRATRFGLRCHQELPAWVTPPAGDSTDLRNEDKIPDAKRDAALDLDAEPGQPLDRLAPRGRLMEVDPDPSVVMQAIKRAEERPGDRDRGLVVRLREVAGRQGAARLGGPARPVKAAWRCDLLENDRERMPVRGGVAEAAIPPYGLVTVRLHVEDFDGTI